MINDDDFAVHNLIVNTVLGALLRQQPTLKTDALAALRVLQTQRNYSGAREQAVIDEAIRAIEAL